MRVRPPSWSVGQDSILLHSDRCAQIQDGTHVEEGILVHESDPLALPGKSLPRRNVPSSKCCAETRLAKIFLVGWGSLSLTERR